MTHPQKRQVVDLSLFDNGSFDRGASRLRELGWILVRERIFERGSLPLSRVRRAALIGFGASLGENLVIRRGLRVTFPWRLHAGDNCWLGEDAWLLNLAPISLGKNVVISQRAFLCTGNHDWSDRRLALAVAPIRVDDGAWIGATAFVGPGVTIGSHAVVTAGSVVTRDLPPYTICSGNPCIPLKDRKVGA